MGNLYADEVAKQCAMECVQVKFNVQMKIENIHETGANVNYFYLNPLQSSLSEPKELQDDVSDEEKLTWELNGCKKRCQRHMDVSREFVCALR